MKDHVEFSKCAKCGGRIWLAGQLWRHGPNGPEHVGDCKPREASNEIPQAPR